jgi:cation transport protein ChaC
VQAVCFVANPADPAYAGRLSAQHIAEVIARSRGQSGSNVDYLRDTVRHLDELGIRAGTAHDVVALLEKSPRV